MLYVITSTDNENSLEKRLGVRPAHLERLQVLQDQGRLIIAGPFPAIDSDDPGTMGFTGSMIVAEFNSQEEAKLWADSDPYAEAGVYHSVTIKPFKPVLP